MPPGPRGAPGAHGPPLSPRPSVPSGPGVAGPGWEARGPYAPVTGKADKVGSRQGLPRGPPADRAGGHVALSRLLLLLRDLKLDTDC